MRLVLQLGPPVAGQALEHAIAIHQAGLDWVRSAMAALGKAPDLGRLGPNGPGGCLGNGVCAMRGGRGLFAVATIGAESFS